MQPRYFWRRAFAFLIDIILVSLLTSALLLPLHKLAPNHVALLNGFLVGKQCMTMPAPPKAFADRIPAGYFTDTTPIGFSLCRISAFFVAESYVGAAFTVERREGSNITKTKSLTQITNEKGKPINALDPSDIIVAMLAMFGFAYLLHNKRGQTPGKRIFGLQVVAKSPDQPSSLKRYIARETLRNIILVGQGLLTLIGFMFLITGSNDAFLAVVAYGMDNMGVYIAVSMIFFAALFLWYILPLIRWRGQMPYDRITGFEVIRPLGGEIQKAAWLK